MLAMGGGEFGGEGMKYREKMDVRLGWDPMQQESLGITWQSPYPPQYVIWDLQTDNTKNEFPDWMKEITKPIVR